LYGHFGKAFCSPHVRLYRTPALPGSALAPLVDCLLAQGLSLREIARRTGANRQRLSAIRSGAPFTFYRRVVDALVDLHDEGCRDHVLNRGAA
jgi:hypothetical protein